MFHLWALPVFDFWPDVWLSNLESCSIQDDDLDDLAACFDNAGRETTKEV